MFGGQRKSRAFTLAEILVVIVILGICSAVIVPKLGSHDDLTLSAAARTLTADLMYAQNLSISQSSVTEAIIEWSYAYAALSRADWELFRVQRGVGEDAG